MTTFEESLYLAKETMLDNTLQSAIEQNNIVCQIKQWRLQHITAKQPPATQKTSNAPLDAYQIKVVRPHGKKRGSITSAATQQA